MRERFLTLPDTETALHLGIWYYAERLAKATGVAVSSPNLNPPSDLDNFASLIESYYHATGREHPAEQYYYALHDGVHDGHRDTKEDDEST